MHGPRHKTLTLLGVALALGAGITGGQNFPIKPIRIVTAEAGGGSDFPARIVAQGLTESLGQPVIVENRPSGVIPAETVSKASPDGYTLIVGAGSLWITPLLQKTSYDPVRDFSPITIIVTTPLVLVVHSTLPVASVQELISLAKARPGELNYGSLPVGSTGHLSTELFKSMANVNIVRIPYKGTASAINDLISGEVQLMFSNAAPVMPHVKSGRLKALAVTTAQPSSLTPGLPTLAETLTGYQAGVFTGIFAPAGTPAAVISKLNLEIVRIIKSPDVKERFFTAGSEIVGNSPQEFSDFINTDMARMGRLIKTIGIHAE